MALQPVADTPAVPEQEVSVSAPQLVRSAPKTRYAELHAHSAFSLLDGASSVETLVAEAARLGLAGLAITDHDGLYAVSRHAEASRDEGLPAIHGAELNMGMPAERTGAPDPGGTHLLVLARGETGYPVLSQLIGRAHLAGPGKGRPAYPNLEEIAAALDGQAMVLSGGCRASHLAQALAAGGTDAAAKELDRLTALFGKHNVAVELVDHQRPGDDARNDALATIADAAGIPVVATNQVHYARPADRRLATIMAATRAGRTLRDMEGWLAPGPTAHLRSAEEMLARFRHRPDALAETVRLAEELAFDLRLLAPDLPPFPVPTGYTEDSWLRHLALDGAAKRYGAKFEHPQAYHRLAEELRIISALGYAGYFLVVHEIVDFCAREGILCQGRGSAANSIVCYALGVTNADPIAYKLLFERFLSPEREGAPDIDIDIENARREEVLQHVYETYGREFTALVATLITYRSKGALRDVARALGYSPGQADVWTAGLPHHREPDPPADDLPAGERIPDDVARYAAQLRGLPRHVGQHVGGMVIADRPVISVVPIEWARMEDRSILQWDKDDCASAGLVKFDLLGLAMLTALRYARDYAANHYDQPLDLAHLPADDQGVFSMICKADTIGVFQIESRAQMSLLPRLKPREFYDLVVGVALVRPGPIQGGAVHPFLRRRAGEEPVVYPHPLAEAALKRTLGVIVHQEQVQMLAIALGGLTGAEADQLRRAMNAKNAEAKLAKLRARLFAGMADRGITGDRAQAVYSALEAFSGYGFPEAHSISFAHIVWQSAFAKRYYPAAFLAGLLAAFPLGFYAPATLVADAKRHGVTVHGPDVNCSQAKASLEDNGTIAPRHGPVSRWGAAGPAVRLGLGQIKGIGDALAETIALGAPYTCLEDLKRRTGAGRKHLEALATGGALECLGHNRRDALWAAGAAARAEPGTLPGTTPGLHAPTLPGMSDLDLARADAWATGIPHAHAISFLRNGLRRRGILSIEEIAGCRNGQRISVAGQIIHRQMPETAAGVMFLSLEDETGIANIICSQGFLVREGRTVQRNNGLIIHGQCQTADGAVSIAAERVTPIWLPLASTSRDFR